MKRTRLSVVACLALLSASVAACGGDDGSEQPGDVDDVDPFGRERGRDRGDREDHQPLRGGASTYSVDVEYFPQGAYNDAVVARRPPTISRASWTWTAR